jgi:hypothetical protein
MNKMNNRGMILLLSFGIIAVLSLLGSAVVSRSVNEANFARRHLETAQAFWLAEAGVNKALKDLRSNYNLSSISATTLGSGGYLAAIVSQADGSRMVTATGYVPSAGAARSQRVLQVRMYRANALPPNFFNNIIYGGGNIVLNGNSFELEGDVRYAGTISGNTSRIEGTITPDASINPLTHLDFNQLRSISQSQGNYHDAGHLNGPFPSSFWYNQSLGIPNVVFLEGNLNLSGNITVGGFFVVGGEVVCDASISGNVAFQGCIYTLGRFTISGGGNALNVDGGVWAGQQVTLSGGVELVYNTTYMNAVSGLNVTSSVRVVSWRDTQNLFAL